MSHDIVKSIKIKNNEVWIKSASNNVRPLTYEEWKSDYYTKILNEQGKNALDIALLKAYEEGNFQGSYVKKYRKALSVLYNLFEEEYKTFNWRTHYGYNSPEQIALDERRKSKEFENLLLKCLNTKEPNDKYIIQQNSYVGLVYGKFTGKCMKWLRDTQKASKYAYLKEAEQVKSYFPNANGWEIKKLVEVVE